jgi:hypothetical protein
MGWVGSSEVIYVLDKKGKGLKKGETITNKDMVQ